MAAYQRLGSRFQVIGLHLSHCHHHYPPVGDRLFNFVGLPPESFGPLVTRALEATRSLTTAGLGQGLGLAD